MAEPTTARPSWITGELMAHTRRVWERRYGRSLTDDECVEMMLNMSLVARALLPQETGRPKGKKPPG